MSKKLEDILKSKLSEQTDDNFNDNFFKKFNNEFAHELETKTLPAQEERGFFQVIFELSWFKPAAIGMCLILIAIVGVRYQQSASVDMQQVAAISPMLNDLEMLADMDNEIGQDMLELSEEEWNVLLEEESQES